MKTLINGTIEAEVCGLDEEVSAYEQPIEFVVGHAGTGKSTKLAERANENSLVLTPTHKAKDVLLDKGLTHVITIHSLLKLVPTLNTEFRKKGQLQRLKQIGDLDLKTINAVIIDEFSMIPTFIMDKLLEMLPSHCKVIVYGDASQLEPVDGLPINPYDYTNDVLILRKQFRAEAPEVVETFERFVSYIETGDHRIDLRMNPAIPHGTLKTFNPETDRILAYTNKRVIELNDQVAKILGLEDGIGVGDEMIANVLMGTMAEFDTMASTIYPNCISKGRLADDWEDKAIATENEIRKYGTVIDQYELVTVLIEGVFYNMWTDQEHYQNNKVFKADVEEIQLELIKTHKLADDENLAKWCRVNRSKELVKDRGQAWSDYLAHSNLIFDLRRPFATTVYKAQGSEFARVYLDQTNMKKAIRGGDYMKYARLMYTSLSRAKKGVVLL